MLKATTPLRALHGSSNRTDGANLLFLLLALLRLVLLLPVAFMRAWEWSQVVRLLDPYCPGDVMDLYSRVRDEVERFCHTPLTDF